MVYRLSQPVFGVEGQLTRRFQRPGDTFGTAGTADGGPEGPQGQRTVRVVPGRRPVPHSRGTGPRPGDQRAASVLGRRLGCAGDSECRIAGQREAVVDSRYVMRTVEGKHRLTERLARRQQLDESPGRVEPDVER